MSGGLSMVQVPSLETLQVGEKRNKVVAITSGILFFTGWWVGIDAAVLYPEEEDLKKVFHVCSVVGTFSMFMINAVSNSQLERDSGCFGICVTRIWFFVGFLLSFLAFFFSGLILIGGYILADPKPQHVYPGVAIFTQNLFIFLASLVYKFGRLEDLWD